MLIDEYFRELEKTVSECPYIINWEIYKDKRSLYIGFIEGKIEFIDQSKLYIMEFVDTNDGVERYKYKYQYQDDQNKMIFRYDMAPHFPEIKTFPHHKHVKAETENIFESDAPTLKDVIDEICMIFTN